MQVILLERTQNLGNVGDLVKVKNGYGRNFLIPQNKALRATADNIKEFEAKRAQIEKENAEKKKDAEKYSSKLENQFLTLIRQAGEDGRLYGSVSARDLAALATETTSVEVKRGQIAQFTPIKNLGIYTIKIELHGEVIVNVYVNVARSNDEAEIAKKEFVSPKKKGENEAEVAAEVNAEAEDTKGKKKKKKIAKVVDVELKDEDNADAAAV
jgi:large subunit ribosomal protein L9